MKQKHLNENHIIGSLFVVVVALAWPTYNSMVGSDDIQTPVSKISQQLTGSEDRVPASIPESPINKFKKFDQIAEVNLGCGKKIESLKTTSHLLQFQGKSCDSSIDFEKVEILNTKNGFSATMFATSSKDFRTDFMHLEPGENTIKLSIRKKNSSLVEESFVVLKE